MPELTVVAGGAEKKVAFAAGARLADVLAAAGFRVARPCGGRGACGKCRVELSGNVSAPNAAEQRAGARLSCQAVLLGDARTVLPEEREYLAIETGGRAEGAAAAPGGTGLGAAVDIGTTTVALRVCDLATGERLGEAAMLNPQTAVAADVIGRIGAALQGQGERLRGMILGALEELLARACVRAGRGPEEVRRMVVTGNTTMLTLLTGRSPEPLSHAPFAAECLFGFEEEMLGRTVYYPPCMAAFVGADISCAVLACGLTRRDAPALLCDIGTNGEIALWKDGLLRVSSTAAGPAFEGAGISCGCGSVRGAVDRVWIERGGICAHTIGDAPAAGICGSGLIDAVAALLASGCMDETGALEEGSASICEGVALTQADIRAVQLAKAAIAAGIETLLEDAGMSGRDVAVTEIAGGFGSHLDVRSAAAIGLIPGELAPRVRAVGNAALAGAERLLLDGAAREEIDAIAARAAHVNLGGSPRFNAHYMDEMLFPEQE